MAEESEIQKLKSKYPKFFARFPSELLEFVFSEETSLEIASICLENGVEDEEAVEKIAYRVTLALLDQVPKENLTEIFEKGAGLDHETAKKISEAIEERIFSQTPTSQSTKSFSDEPETILPPETRLRTGSKERRKDGYRETFE